MLNINLTQNIQVTQSHCVKLTFEYIKNTKLLTRIGFNANIFFYLFCIRENLSEISFDKPETISLCPSSILIVEIDLSRYNNIRN